MWQAIKSFFGSQAATLGGIGIKVWQVTLVTIIIITGTTGTYFYLSFSTHQQSQQKQNVIMLVGGLNTSINPGSCTVDGFEPLIKELTSTMHFTNPYDTGCPPSQVMNNSPISLAYFSYLGGKLNPSTGVWEPAPYGRCAPDSISLNADDIAFVDTLYTYRAHYPNAHFTIIGHSLGGLVALTGASEFIDHYGVGNIDKVITLDSPLNGVPDKMWTGEASDSSGMCQFFTGPIVQSLNAIYKTPDVTKLDVTYLEKKGTAVYTLGNDADCLYENGVVCTPDILKPYGVTSLLSDTQTQYEENAYIRIYHLPEHTSSLFSGEVPGHGAILSSQSQGALKDIKRFVLAPQVTITQPKPKDFQWFDTAGEDTALSYSATVRCLWGNANHATAMISLQDGSNVFAGISTQSSDGNTLALNGIVNLPPAIKGSEAFFFIDAGENACQYAYNTPLSILPTSSDYFGGKTMGIPFFLDGGKLAVGLSGQLYAGRPANGSISNTPLDYTQFNQNTYSNSIQSIAWAHNGTKAAYLIQTSSAYGGATGDTTTTSSDLYIASSSLTEPTKLTSNLTNAVALTWNALDDQIAILEETESHNGSGPGGFFFTPSIVIVDASTGVGRHHINLPASANTFLGECGQNCHTPRVRLQWAANGAFLLGYANVGSTLATVSGQASELETGQNVLQDSMPLGAMNTQGTLVAYPVSPGSGQVNINLYQVNASTGSLSNPTTLVSLNDQNLGGNSTTDFSPDGTKIGLCSGSEVVVVDIQHPATTQKLVTLPAGSQTSLACENLRWSPDGQSLIIQIIGYNIGAGGLAELPLNGGSPQILFGCNLSYTTAFQYDENGGTNCYGDTPIFDIQPMGHNQSNAPMSSPPNPTDNSKLLAQSATLTVGAGQSFDIYFDYENAGNTTWTGKDGFTFACDQYYNPTSNCLGGVTQSLNDAQVPPGDQATFYLSLTAPTTPGTYQTAWDMRSKGHIFGQNHVFVTVTVTASSQSLTSVDWANFTYTSSCYSNQPQQFTVKNGKAYSNNIWFAVEKPIYGDLTGDGQPEAVILYSCVAADSFGPHALIYSGNAAHPVLLAELPSQDESLSRVASATIVNGLLQLTGQGYALGDPSCCPSLQVTTTYRWNGTQFVVVNSVSK